MNNLAACYLTKKEYYKAREVLVSLLEFDSQNVKALLRATKASLGLHEYYEAEICLEHVLELDPGNMTALKEQARLKQMQKLYADKNKVMMKNMAKSFSSESKKSEPIQKIETDSEVKLDNQVEKMEERKNEEEDIINCNHEVGNDICSKATSSIEMVKDETYSALWKYALIVIMLAIVLGINLTSVSDTTP
jgi:tetratricopeptide (TPR) repeat protein